MEGCLFIPLLRAPQQYTFPRGKAIFIVDKFRTRETSPSCKLKPLVGWNGGRLYAFPR